MNIHFTPKSFDTNLVAQFTDKSTGKLRRVFQYEQPSKNKHIDKTRILIQDLAQKGKSWIVSDYEVYDTKSGKVVKSLKRDMTGEDSFVSTVKKENYLGNYDTISISHNNGKVEKY